MTPADFSAAFPAFADARVEDVQRHINAAAFVIDATRWGDSYDEGLGCFVAHRLLIEERAKRTKNDDAFRADIISETGGGLTTIRSSDIVKARVADPYLTTSYGQRYRQLARRVGTGAVAV